MIPIHTFDNLYPSLRHFAKIGSGMTTAIKFSRQNDAGSPAHYLVLSKARSRGRLRLKILRLLCREVRNWHWEEQLLGQNMEKNKII